MSAADNHGSRLTTLFIAMSVWMDSVWDDSLSRQALQQAETGMEPLAHC